MVFDSASENYMSFKGTAHPTPNAERGCPADMSAGEVVAEQLGKGPRGIGTQLLFEHDPGTRVGTVHSSWPGRDGSLQVSGVVTDPATARAVRAGELRGLSLGTSVTHDATGAALFRKQDELSLCETPRRENCYVHTIDGVSVRSTSRASAKAGAPHPSLAAIRSRAARRMGSPGQRASMDPLAGATGLSAETSAELQEELRVLREKLSCEKARNQVRDQQQHAALGTFKPDICEYTMTLAEEDGISYKHEIVPTLNWFKEVDSTDKPETVFSLARTFYTASARDKRMREEIASRDRALEEKTIELTNANKLHDEKDERIEKAAKRESELVSENQEIKATLERLQTEVAKHGYLRDKIDFSSKAARENTPVDAPLALNGTLKTTTVKHDASASSSSPYTTIANTLAPEDDLLRFLSSGNRNIDSRRVMPNLPASGSATSMPLDIAAALKTY